MKKLSDVLNGLPPVNFNEKQERLIEYISVKFPECKEALEIAKEFKKSATVTFPQDFPLSKDFLQTLYNTETSEDLLPLLKKRLKDQNKMIKRDVATAIQLFQQHSSLMLSDLSLLHHYSQNGNVQLDENELKELHELTLQLQLKLRQLKSNSKF